MKNILFVEYDRDIRDYLSQFIANQPDPGLSVRMLPNLNEAETLLRREVLDAVIIDAVSPNSRDLFDFIRQIRHRDYKLPVLTLLAYSDMILNRGLKEDLLREKVSITNKIESLKNERISRLFRAAYEHGYGETVEFAD